MQGLITFIATLFAVTVLFGTTKDMPFAKAAFVVCPILYLLSFLSIFGLKEITSGAQATTNALSEGMAEG